MEDQPRSFTLTAPKLIIRSEITRIQGGTFAGDVYVEADSFAIVNAIVKGNVLFADDKYQSAFDTFDIKGLNNEEKI